MTTKEETTVDAHAVQELLDRDAIRTVLQRYCRAVDRRDVDLLRSVYHEDGVHEHGRYQMNGWRFAELIIESVGQFQLTTHHLTNQLVDLAGDKARAESYVIAVHRLERELDPVSGERGEVEQTLSLRYIDDFARRDGEWRIVRRVAVHDWSREAPVGAPWPDAKLMVQGRRDRGDPSY